MGQEQSGETPSTAQNAQINNVPHQGVVLVPGTGTQVRSNAPKDDIDRLLDKSATLPLPQPLLPPSTVEDNITSALQGAKMMQELRTLFDGLMVGSDGQPSALSNVVGLSSSSLPQPESQASSILSGLQNTFSFSMKNEDQTGNGPTKNSDQTVTAGDMNMQQPPVNSSKIKSELNHEAWRQFGADSHILDRVISTCAGGTRMTNVVEQQKLILQKIIELHKLASQLHDVVEENRKDARQISRAIEHLDRLSLTVADVNEQLEQVLATANILGAAHFADDEQLCSFKEFLKHNPPKIE